MDYSQAQARNVGMAAASMQQQAQAVRESTQLEVHLTSLRDLQDELNKAFARTLTSADRLLGQEPPSISKNPDSPKDPVQPPILRQLEIAASQLHEIAQSIHYQLNRLERL